MYDFLLSESWPGAVLFVGALLLIVLFAVQLLRDSNEPALHLPHLRHRDHRTAHARR